MSLQTPTKKLPAHPHRPSTLPFPFRMLLCNTRIGRLPVRHNLAPSTPTFSNRNTSHVTTQISPLPLHQLQALLPLSPPLHQVRLVRRAFLQSNSPKVATAITLRTPLSLARTFSLRKSPLPLTTFDGDLAVTTCRQRRDACAPFILIISTVHLTFPCLASNPS